MARKTVVIDTETGEVIGEKKNKKGRSGCKLHHDFGSDKGLFMTVWKVVDGVMCKGKIFRSEKQQKESAVKTAKTGMRYVSVTLVFEKPLAPTTIMHGIFDLGSKRAMFPQHNMIANPKANNGGYFGKRYSKKFKPSR
ncbi:MAG: hypothetical protein KGV44_12830 [Flavobacteriaceae bacterium]|nr:hypothetical protein [Flavobacteriaceae bacterium]